MDKAWMLSSSAEQAPPWPGQEGGTVKEIVKAMQERRKSARDVAANDEDWNLQNFLFQMDMDLKSQLAKMEQKLERLGDRLSSLSGERLSIPKGPHRAPLVRRASVGSSPPLLREISMIRSGQESSDHSDAREAGMVPGTPSHELPRPPTVSPAWLMTPQLVATGSRDSSTSESAVKLGGQFSMPSMPSSSLHASHIDELIRNKITRAEDKRSRLFLSAWQFLEEPESSLPALWVSRAISALVITNVAVSLLSWSRNRTSLSSTNFAIESFHLFFDVLCTTELVVRFLVCPRRWAFLAGPLNWADTIAGLVVVFRSLWLASAEQETSVGEILHTVVPVVWLLKLLRNFEKFHLLCNAFVIASEALPVLLFTLLTLVLSFGGLIYLLEPRDVFESQSQAFWFTIVTMMTVGYGDITPSTSPGTIMTSILMVGSQLYMAIPLGIVGGSFSRVWENRDRFLLIRRTRVRLTQWGYTPEDLLELFYHYDTGKKGELDIYDFKTMMNDMKLGLTDERVKHLFKSLDEDCNGHIDYQEFLGALFPGFAHLALDSSTPA